MKPIVTNADSPKTARSLRLLVESLGNRVRFASFSTRHAGVLVGDTRFGDDEVHAVVMVNVDYKAMVERSIVRLERALRSPNFRQQVLEGITKKGLTDTVKGKPITMEDVQDAIGGTSPRRKGLLVALYETATGNNADSTSAHVYQPLEVDGKCVQGCKVYVGDNPRNDDGDELAPKVGGIYVEGVTISKRVITPAPNGPAPKARKGAVVVVKEYLCDALDLPHAKFRQYRLHPDTLYLIQSGDILIQ